MVLKVCSISTISNFCYNHYANIICLDITKKTIVFWTSSTPTPTLMYSIAHWCCRCSLTSNYNVQVGLLETYQSTCSCIKYQLWKYNRISKSNSFTTSHFMAYEMLLATPNVDCMWRNSSKRLSALCRELKALRCLQLLFRPLPVFLRLEVTEESFSTEVSLVASLFPWHTARKLSKRRSALRLELKDCRHV